MNSHAVLTGPTADAVAHAIAVRYRDEGHPTDPNYTYDEEH